MMKIFGSLAVFTSVFLLVSCSKNHALDCHPFTDSARVTVKYGAIVNLFPDASYSLKFAKVYDDSRCPANANCIWQGTAHIGITLNNSTDTIVLEVFKPLQKIINAENYTLKLETLSPYPYDAPINVNDYEAVISIKK